MPSHPTAAEYFTVGTQQHQAGQLREAEQSYKQALSLDPAHIDSLHSLGVLALQAGRPDLSIDLIGRAISLNPQNPEFHFNQGLALGAMGRFKDAAEQNRRAIELKPDYAEAHMNLGNALKAQGNNEEAISNFKNALALQPLFAVAHFNLANALSDLGRLDEAEKHYRESLAIRPDYAEAMTNLGSILGLQGKNGEAEAQHEAAIAAKSNLFQAHANLGNLSLARREYDQAIGFFRNALSINPAFAEAYVNLASALWAVNKKQEALENVQKAFTLKPTLTVAFYNFIDLLLASDRYGDALQVFRFRLSLEDTAEMRALFAQYLGDPRAIPCANEYKDILARAILEHWGNSRGLVDVSLHVLAKNPSIAPIIARAVDNWPGRPSAAALLGEHGLNALASDDLLRVVLTCERINSPEFEIFLSSLRSAFLEMISKPNGFDLRKNISLISALAQQCFLNEYVYFTPEQEAKLANQLRTDLRNDLQQNKIPSSAAIAVTACYFPLISIEEMQFNFWSNSPSDIKKLVQQQVLEPRQEREYRAIIPRLTSVTDVISKKVQRLYEENPSPRWTRVMSNVRRMKLSDYLQQILPNLPVPHALENKNYLIAGCGTGQQVAALLSNVEVENILAVDLSLSNLAYAKRMLDQLGITHVEYGQADILRLPELGRIFDVIEAVGVLHHLYAPEHGWKVLLSTLRPGGLMRVALYSKRARRDIIAAQHEIAKDGFGDNADEIRACRQKVMSMDPTTSIFKLTRFPDFFSLSECRDLLFHVQEHTFTLPQIARFIAENGLAFLGFELPISIREKYAREFRNDNAGNNLKSWEEFELLNPDTFIGMYYFWIQKIR